MVQLECSQKGFNFLSMVIHSANRFRTSLTESVLFTKIMQSENVAILNALSKFVYNAFKARSEFKIENKESIIIHYSV